MVNWRKIGLGVAAATIGAAAFGAVHFMFLAPQWGVGDFMGVPLNVLLPFLLGILGFVGTTLWVKKEGIAKNIMTFGSAAAIGFGVAQYAGWVTTPVVARARARTFIAPTPIPARPLTIQQGTKLI